MLGHAGAGINNIFKWLKNSLRNVMSFLRKGINISNPFGTLKYVVGFLPFKFDTVRIIPSGRRVAIVNVKRTPLNKAMPKL